MWLLKNVLVFLAIYQAQGCQPEFTDGAFDMVTVGYDRLRTSAVYIDTLSVEMKNRKKFSQLLTAGCNGRRDARIAFAIKKEGTDEWEEKATDIKVTARSHDGVKDLDPCSKYEVKILVKSLKDKEAETRELTGFTVGSLRELNPEDLVIAKFKGDALNYYTEHFKSEYSQVMDTSFTVKWEPICAQMISIWVKSEDQEWGDVEEMKIDNYLNNPKSEQTFSVAPCKVYEVVFDIYIDSEGQHVEEINLDSITTDPDKEVLESKFFEHTFDNISSVLMWDYTKVLDEFECIDSFNYTLVKDENGEVNTLLEGTDKDLEAQEFPVGSVESVCNFCVRMEIGYQTLENNVDSVEAFEEHVHKKDQPDNAIAVGESSITYAVNPCMEQDSEIVIGLVEIGKKGRDLFEMTKEKNLAGKVIVDKSETNIERSSFDDMNIKSCAAYKIMLLKRTTNEEFKELETTEFQNPNWNSWNAPNVYEKEKTSTTITLNITDLETNGECVVGQYNISCVNLDGDDSNEQTFHSNDDLTLDGLLPETKYKCVGRITHNIPGAGEFDTPWSDFVIIETNPVPTTTTTTTTTKTTPETTPETAPETTPEATPESTPETESETQSVPDTHSEPEENIGAKDLEENTELTLALIITGICLALITSGGCYWWHCIRDRKEQKVNQEVNLSYRASATAGAKAVEMNSAVLTDSQDDQMKDVEVGTPDIKETIVDIPTEEDKATTSTEGTTIKDENLQRESESPQTNSHVETKKEGTPIEDDKTLSSDPPSNSEVSSAAEIPLKDPEPTAIP